MYVPQTPRTYGILAAVSIASHFDFRIPNFYVAGSAADIELPLRHVRHHMSAFGTPLSRCSQAPTADFRTFAGDCGYTSGPYVTSCIAPQRTGDNRTTLVADQQATYCRKLADSSSRACARITTARSRLSAPGRVHSTGPLCGCASGVRREGELRCVLSGDGGRGGREEKEV